MRYRQSIFKTLLLVWMVTGWGCCFVPDTGKPGMLPMPIYLSAGSAVMLCEARTGFFGTEIVPFRRAMRLPGIALKRAPETRPGFGNLDQRIRKIIKQAGVAMVILIEPETITEREYNPRAILSGFRIRYHRVGNRAGQAMIVPQAVPEYQIEYQQRCRRTAFRLRVYGKDGLLMGRTRIHSAAFQPCPEESDRNLDYDDFEYVLAWIRTHIRPH